MLIGNIYLKQNHLMLRDVDGSEVSLTLDDALDMYNFVKDHLKAIRIETRLCNISLVLLQETQKKREDVPG